MKELKNKKGAIELSLNLIIMLIIGMVILALVIGFVTRLVNQGSSEFENQLTGSDQEELQRLAQNCKDNLCITPHGNINIKKGEESKVYIYARNIQNSEQISCIPGPLSTCTNFETEIYKDDGTVYTEDEIKFTGEGFSIDAGKGESKMYMIRTTEEIPVGVYYLTIYYSADDQSASTTTHTNSKSLTINIK
ncbi:MAG: hypothetical protein ACOC16_04125 [Nanoarchaeota archaeon]